MPLDGQKQDSTDAWAEELAEELAQRLDGWAIGREKVLAKLDIRGAKAARALARSLRLVARALAETAPGAYVGERKAKVARIVELRKDALRLMSSGASPISEAELLELEKLGAEDIGELAEQALLDEESKERPTLSPPAPSGPAQSGPAQSGPAESVPTQSGPAQSGERPRNDEVTGSHSPDAIRASRAQGLAPKASEAGGLGDYIARIRRLKG